MSLENWMSMVQTLAIIAASATAIYGINSWRRELSGKKRYELAEEALTLFYKVKDAISAIRNPFGYESEGRSRPAAPGENIDQKKARDQAYVLWERYLKHEDTFNKIRALRYRFMAIFGGNTARPFEKLDKIVQEFWISVDMLSYAWYRMSQIDLSKENAEIDNLVQQVERYKAVFWEGLRKPDPINEIVGEMIKEIERICIPVLSGKMEKQDN